MMSNRLLIWMTGLVIFCIGVLLFLNIMPFIWTPNVEKYLKLNDVRGMAVEHNQKLYTLNFEQQNAVVMYLNQAIPVSNSTQAKAYATKTNLKDKSTNLDIAKIVIYRFNLPDLTIVPLEYVKNNLVFSSPSWNSEGLLKDVSGGKLQNLLSQTYEAIP